MFKGEFGGWKTNITTVLLDLFAQIGWVYDRKFATPKIISRKAMKSGDGSHRYLSHESAHETSLWGFGDRDLEIDDVKELEKLKL